MEELEQIVRQAAGKIELPIDKIDFNHPPQYQFGDYSTNIALELGNQTKQNPRELAEKIVDKIEKTESVDKIEIAGPGFINFYMSREWLLAKTEQLNYELEFKNRLRKQGKEGKTMVIDYSAPNIAKPFGIGHLRSTDIGQAIYNLYKILGWKCIGDNHLGDWGTQFGKLIVAIKKWGSVKQNIDSLTIADLEKLYVKFHAEAEKDESLIEEGREWFLKLEKGEPEAREIWQKMIDLSMIEYDRVYRLLGVKIDNALGESFYQDKMPAVIEEIREKKLTKISREAEIVEFAKIPPAMLIKSNGATTYFTRDLATIKYRIERWNPDKIVYEVGADHVLHFNQVFETARMLGWIKKDQLVHVAHGMIRKKGGKLSTRKGDTIHLTEVIDKALEQARQIAKKSKINKEMTKAEEEEMIKKVAIGAIKFRDLLSDPRRDIIFDWETIMSLDGDSGPYLQYTYARCMSVLEKSKIREQKNISPEHVADKLSKEEEQLLKELYKFEEKISEAAERFSPSVIAEWLLLVARSYNEFYANNRIIDEKEETFRIFLTHATASVLEMGLGLLGIETVEKM